MKRLPQILVVLSIIFTITFSFQNTFSQINVLHIEDFETEGEGVRYTRSHQLDSVGSFFKRGTSSQFLGKGHTPTNIQNSNFFAIQNTNGGGGDAGVVSGAPSTGLCTLQLKDVNISNYDTLFILYWLSAKDQQIYGPFKASWSGFYMDLDYQIDNGSWITIGKTRNSDKNVFTPLFDKSNSGITGDVANAGIDTKIIANFQEFADTLVNSGAGDTLRIRFVFKSNDPFKMLALDKIKVRGNVSTSPPSNRVRLLYSYCDYITTNKNVNIWSIGEDGYSPDSVEFEFSGGDLGSPVSVTKKSGGLNLATVAGLNYSQTYDIRVRGFSGATAEVWSNSWGNSCKIIIDTALVNMVTTCGSTVSIYQQLNAFEIGGATNYRFRVNGGTPFVTGGNRYFTLNDAGFSSNGSYTIEAAAFVNGGWTSYGNPCTYSVTGGAPSIKLNKLQCGDTFNNLNSALFTTNVAGATNYDWRIVGNSQTITVSSGTDPYVLLSSFSNVALDGGTYSVRARVTVGGLTGAFGTSCNITTGSGIPQTSIANCSGTINQNSVLYANIVGGASEYLFNIDGIIKDTIISRSYGSFSFSELSGSGFGPDTYSITVRAVITDTSVAGTACNFSLISGMKQRNSEMGRSVSFGKEDVIVYPNPSHDYFEIQSESKIISSYVLFDLQGRSLTEKRAELEPADSMHEIVDISSLPVGIYQLIVLFSDGNRTQVKVIKK